ncbi:hypothetical protein Trydic_g3769 [Trypoxylus dichotomus]
MTLYLSSCSYGDRNYQSQVANKVALLLPDLVINFLLLASYKQTVACSSSIFSYSIGHLSVVLSEPCKGWILICIVFPAEEAEASLLAAVQANEHPRAARTMHFKNFP